MLRLPLRLATAVLLAGLAFAVSAQEAAIRKNLAERLPQLPKIDEVSKTPVPGLWEVRFGTDVIYTDERGDFIVQGAIFDTRSRTNITEERLNKLSAIDFASLPLKDAMVVKQGNGKRRIAVFADPNCGFCKRFERDLLNVKDVTIYTFLYPILGPDSNEKSRAIWCSKDPMKTWRDWMIEGVVPPKVIGGCDDAAIARNVEFGQKHRVQGTPAIIYEDGKRVPGAVSAAEIEKQLAISSKS
ncbi:MAG: DsbC family protein [Burkholderiaceae bacterium]|jgi:thiol:disulfide interchange protein DsbC|nr:DsbC family protein [Burkholderiaceae bacterium]